jgi:glycosyltransferase involved in cell wall biosynthesis
MRILFVPHVYAPVVGGAQLYCRRVAETLAGAGHEVHVVTADLSSAEGYYRFGIPPIGPRRELRAGVMIERVPFGGLAYRLGGSAGRDTLPATMVQRWMMSLARHHFTRRLDRQLLRLRPDAVVTLPHLFMNVRSVLHLQRRRSFPLVIVPLLHESDPNWPTAQMRLAVRSADAVIAMTGHEQARLVDSYGADPDRVFVAPPGVDSPSLPTIEEGAPSFILYLGRLSEGKGLDLLRAAMPLVWQQRPDTELVVAGTHETGWSSSRWGGGPVRIVSSPTEAEKWSLLASCRCLVLPSRNESFGIVVLESWAAGRPVIALDLPVLRATVTDGVDGLLVPDASPTAMAAAIVKMLDDPDLATAMGAAGRRKVHDAYTWRATANAAMGAIRRAAHPAPGQAGEGL